MLQPRDKTRYASAKPRPPRYPTEQPCQDRSPENDKKALIIAKLAYEALVKWQEKGIGNSDADVNSKALAAQEDSENELRSGLKPLHTLREVTDEIMLPLKSMYGGTEWPREKDPFRGAKQPSWGNIGFPDDRSLVVKDFERETHIDLEQPSVIEISEDIISIKTKPAKQIADVGKVKRWREHGRIIERFKLHSRTVCKVRLEDADIYSKGSTYSRCKISQEVENVITKAIGNQPALEVEQWVAAQILLARAGQIGGRSQDYWRKARDLAQQQLFLNHELEALILRLVKFCIKQESFNPYHQAQRDEYAVAHDVFYYIEDTDVVLVLDKSANVIAFQFSDAFRHLLTKAVEKEVTESMETFSSLYAVPLPDMTRHGLHWIDWLVKHPEFDFRIPENDPVMAKSGVYHFGGRCGNGDPGVDTTRDLQTRHEGKGHILMQMQKLRYSAFGACTELVTFFFNLLDSDLLAQYRKVANEVSKLGYIPFETRRQNEPFVLRTALVNLMTNDHRDQSGWHHGLTGLAPVGDFEGGDLLLREAGLRIESKPGCVQLIRGKELRHSISEWSGRRFVIVSSTHEAVRRRAYGQMEEPVTDATLSGDGSYVDILQEDILPEDQIILTERDRILERYIGLEDSEEMEDSDSSDASGEQSDRDDHTAASASKKVRKS
ncbi:hypothetical protein F5B20DRAFT_593578 [Whalleya microplaca]|nr:hypothetical protein F5B20DRAFT_593578 [Whalleya microplaca]